MLIFLSIYRSINQSQRGLLMDEKVLELLYNKSDEFGNIARKVNESSKKRKDHSEFAITYIDKVRELGDVLADEIDKVANANIKQRETDNLILNSCLVLKNNCKRQKELLDKIKKKNGINDAQENEITPKIENFIKDLDEALTNVRNIIEIDNDIILQDKLLGKHKEIQMESVQNLLKLTQISLEDAEKAIAGSSSNLDRGLAMVEKFKDVKKLIESKNTEELNNLLDETNKGWNIAVEVNNSSRAQLEFAESVNQETENLHNDANTLKELIIKKHHEYEANIQTVTVLTVLISVKLKKYLAIEEIVENIEYNENVRGLLNDFKSYVRIACEEVKNLNELNLDMTEYSHLNNEVETKTVELTKEEIDYYDKIKQKVGEMTDATKYPIEGSGENIDNGKELEEKLKALIDEM